MKYKIIVINGPNLNLLGEREKEKYGDISLKKIEAECLGFAAKNNIELTFKQSNIEGEIINLIQSAKKKFNGIVINAAGYTHTSVAILDALLSVKLPIIEIHISNIYAREEFRQKSLISRAANGIICGFGINSYIMALDAIKDL